MKGFTLVELVIVVALLGIISAIGIPLYNGYVDTARVNAAQTGLQMIYLQQQEYYTDNNAYYSNTTGTCDTTDYSSAIETALLGGQSVLDTTYFTFCIQEDPAVDDDFLVVATDVDGSRTFSIDENNVTSY